MKYVRVSCYPTQKLDPGMCVVVYVAVVVVDKNSIAPLSYLSVVNNNWLPRSNLQNCCTSTVDKEVLML